METITLLRTIKDEYCPRVYTLSGGEFEPMKDAVKALGGTFDRNPFPRWKTTAEIHKSLKEQGFTIEKQPDFSINLNEIPSILTPIREHEYRLDVSFSLRNSDGSQAASNLSGRYHTALHILVSEEYMQAYIPILEARYKENGYSFSPKPRDVVADAVKHARSLFGERMRSIFEQYTKKRTIEDFKAGLAAVKAASEEENATLFVATVVDNNPVILPGNEPEAQRIKQENDILEHVKKEARDKKRADEHAEKMANAPKYIKEWFERLNKAEIAERLQTLVQVNLEAKQKKMTKVQLIESVVADRELCEKLIG